MKLKLFVFFFSAFSISHWCNGQHTASMTVFFGSESREIRDILDFQDISIAKINFSGNALAGKFYDVIIKEFKDGILVNSKTLFDGSEASFFKIDSTQMSLKIFTCTKNNQLETWVRGKGFGSRKDYFKLQSTNGAYAIKDFFGGKDYLEISTTEEFPVLAIITPTKHEDGSGSYCEVVQANVKPENLGTHFKIPHYFLITMKFK